MLNVLLMMLLGYLMGCPPNGYWAGKLFKGVDIRDFGSGNIGFANVLRVMGLKVGLPVLAADILKGALAVALVPMVAAYVRPVPPIVSPEVAKLLVGMAAIVGHNWTIFLRFKGGKGVATSIGVFLALAPKVALMLIMVFIIVVAITRYISLGSITGAVLLPVLLAVFHYPTVYTVFAVAVSASVVWLHRGNIKRLIRGEENKVFQATAPKATVEETAEPGEMTS